MRKRHRRACPLQLHSGKQEYVIQTEHAPHYFEIQPKHNKSTAHRNTVDIASKTQRPNRTNSRRSLASEPFHPFEKDTRNHLAHIISRLGAFSIVRVETSRKSRGWWEVAGSCWGCLITFGSNGCRAADQLCCPAGDSNPLMEHRLVFGCFLIFIFFPSRLFPFLILFSFGENRRLFRTVFVLGRIRVVIGKM